DADTLVDAQERHEAWVLAAEADLALGNGFRAGKSAEKAAQGPGSRDHPDLVTRAQLVLARCHLAKGAVDRAEEVAGRARDVAVREDLKDLLAEATALLGELVAVRERARASASSQAEACFSTARELWDKLALELAAERRPAFLAHPRRQTSRPSTLA